jgi:hypothetical protein
MLQNKSKKSVFGQRYLFDGFKELIFCSVFGPFEQGLFHIICQDVLVTFGLDSINPFAVDTKKTFHKSA